MASNDPLSAVNASLDALFSRLGSSAAFDLPGGITGGDVPQESLAGDGQIQPAGWVANADSSTGTATVTIDATGITVLNGKIQVSDANGTVLILNGTVTADAILANSITVGKFAQNTNNEVSNGGFDLLATGHPADGVFVDVINTPILAGWDQDTLYLTHGVMAWTATNPHGAGGYCMLLRSNGAGSTSVSTGAIHHASDGGSGPVVGGRKYRVSYWLRGQAGNAVGTAKIYISEWNAMIGGSRTDTALPLRTLGASTAWVQYSDDFTFRADTVAWGMQLQNFSGTNGDIVAWDDIEVYPIDYDINHAAGNVVINSTGLTINNGKLTINDQFGQNVLTGGGFGGAWLAFLGAGGVYNADFGVGTTNNITAATLVGTASTEADYQASMSLDIPYWGVSVRTGTGTLQRQSSPTAPSLMALRWGDVNGAIATEIFQDIPVTPGQFYNINLLWLHAGSFTTVITAEFRQADRSALGSGTISGGLSYTATVGAYVIEPIMATGLVPAGVKFVRLKINMTRDSGTPAAFIGKVFAIPLAYYDTISIQSPTATLDLFNTPYDGGASLFPNLRLNSSGSIQWGAAGTSLLDTSLVRTGAGLMTLTDLSATASSALTMGTIALSTAINGGSLGSSQNNWNPTGLSRTTVIRVAATTPISITGLVARSQGSLVWLVNTGGTNSITLVHSSASSTAGNRFFCKGAVSYVLTPGASALLMYDAAIAFWMVNGSG